MVADRYNPGSDISPEFISRVNTWIAASGEVFVVLRYLRAAGAKDYALCRSADDFAALVDSAPIGTDIEVFRDSQLPLRGRVTPEFIVEILRRCEHNRDSEFMVVSLRRRDSSVLAAHSAFGGAEDVRDALAELIGQEVAFGPCPKFIAPDSDELVSASKGGIDGPR